MFNANIRLHNLEIPLEVEDTADNEAFLPMKDSYVKRSNSLVVLYSIEDRKSLKFAEQILQRYRGHKPLIPIILVGHKVDVPLDKRIISYDEGMEIAKRFDAAFIEASAKEDVNIQTIFCAAAELHLIRENELSA